MSNAQQRIQVDHEMVAMTAILFDSEAIRNASDVSDASNPKVISV